MEFPIIDGGVKELFSSRGKIGKRLFIIITII